MSEANITKKALAAAMKELMQEHPFSKITVNEICQRCELSRKSFYYHFMDKYDLMNWIFDTEFLALQSPTNIDEGLRHLCSYFYQNRRFYRQALETQGPNSFREYFRALCCPFFRRQLHALIPLPEDDSFYIQFCADAFICSLERWILQDDPVPPDQFVDQLNTCLQLLSSATVQNSSST